MNKILRFWLIINSLCLPFIGLGLQLSAEPVQYLSAPTNVTWARDNWDLPSLVFDIRFMRGLQDVGLAFAQAEMGIGELFGTISVQFPTKGLYTLAAVVENGSPDILEKIAESKRIAVLDIPPPTTSSTTSTSTASATSTSTSTPRIQEPAGPHIGALISAILGSMFLVALLCALYLCIWQRRQSVRRRLTFHRERMMAQRMPNADRSPTLYSKSLMDPDKEMSSCSLEDLESTTSPQTPLMLDVGDRSSASHHSETTGTQHMHESRTPKAQHTTTGHGSSLSAPQMSTE